VRRAGDRYRGRDLVARLDRVAHNLRPDEPGYGVERGDVVAEVGAADEDAGLLLAVVGVAIEADIVIRLRRLAVRAVQLGHDPVARDLAVGVARAVGVDVAVVEVERIRASGRPDAAGAGRWAAGQ